MKNMKEAMMVTKMLVEKKPQRRKGEFVAL
jgi:hypothetical protein